MDNDFVKSKPLDWITNDLHPEDLPEGQITYGGVDIFEDRVGRRLRLPVIAIKGETSGPILGLTAAVHGNELNGIPTIHQLIENINPSHLQGTLITIPIVNLPGYLAYTREFIDGVDLNRIMPGKSDGQPSDRYAFNLTHKILKKFDVHLDLHTASFGRINSHYIRANLKLPKVKQLTELQHADIIVNTEGPANSVRQTAMDYGIPSITIELGNPQIFQQHIVNAATKSILNVLIHYKMIEGEISIPEHQPVICSRSYWTRVNDGGILRVKPKLTEIIEQNQIMATLYDVYGRKELDYLSPERGIVIGKSVNPVVSTGDRILHLGVLK